MIGKVRATEYVEDKVLKTVQPWFDLVWSGDKTFEIRKLGRDFQVGQIWDLREYDAGSKQFGNRMVHILLMHILRDIYFPEGLKEGYGVISFRKINNFNICDFDNFDWENEDV